MFVALVFRFFPNAGVLQSCWSEKVFSDAVALQKEWVMSTNIDKYVLVWHLEDKKQLNNRNYGIRLFVINVDGTDIPESSLLQLTQHIATCINEEPDNNVICSVDPKDFIWSRDFVWQEIVGTQAALMRLRFKTKQTFNPGFYESYKDEIYHYFREGAFPYEAARQIGAPMEEVDKTTLPEEPQQEDNNTENEDDI